MAVVLPLTLPDGLRARPLQAAVGQGYATSSLTVDAANPTGALGVYDRRASGCTAAR